MNICGNFYRNPSTKYRDIASHEIRVNRPIMDGLPENTMPSPPVVVLLWLFEKHIKTKTK